MVKTFRISGDNIILVVGTTYNDINVSKSGNMWIYHHIGNYWVKFGDGIYRESPSDFWGFSVTNSGDSNIVAVGDLDTMKILWSICRLRFIIIPVV